jgi:predicted nucleic acid-binding protein
MIVLDASVAAKWFLIEAESDVAVDIARRILRGDDTFAVPELFFYEVFSVVSRKHQDPARWAARGVEWLFQLPLQRVGMSPSLARRMAEFTRQGLTGYDAAYAALARAYDAVWLTFDTHAAKLLGEPSWVRSRLT